MPYKTSQRTISDRPESALHEAGEEQQLALVAQLAASGAEGIGTLVDAYSESRTSRLRCYILDILCKSEDLRVLSLIEAGLVDPSTTTRCHAIEALVSHPGSEPDRLLAPLLRDASSAPRCRAIDAAAKLGCRSSHIVDELLACAAHSDWRTRTAAARALGELRIERAADCLRKLTGDVRTVARVAAAASLQQLAAQHGV